jgi:hypothetical protein
MRNAALQSTITAGASAGGTLSGMNANIKSGGSSRAILISQPAAAPQLVSKGLEMALKGSDNLVRYASSLKSQGNCP